MEAAAAHRRPTLIVDNYDSYTHNLYQMCWSVSGVQPILIRNDEEETFLALLAQRVFDNVIISPGPGSPDRPQDFGICAKILENPPVPVFGVCLGCQGIGWMYGLDVRKAPGGAVHGRTSAVFHHDNAQGGGGLFAGIPNGFKAVRYHSLAICAKFPGDPFPEVLERTAWTAEGVVMGLRHRSLPLWGVQFHPESICTEFGEQLLGNFLALADAHNASLDCINREAVIQPCSWGPGLNRREPKTTETGCKHSASSSTTSHHTPSSTTSHRTPIAGQVCNAYQLMFSKVGVKLEAETFYMSALANDARSFWLDSSRREPGMARFSYMGGSTGPLCYQVSYNLSQRTLHMTLADGCEETRRDCDVLAFLEEQLAACKLDEQHEAQLPFEFHGGFVGYLGYELKELCEDGAGEANRHRSDEPDAVLLFADRYLVWDHQESEVYAVALASTGDAESESAATQWLQATLNQVLRLSSLPLRDTLVEKYEAMRLAEDKLGCSQQPEHQQHKQRHVTTVTSSPASPAMAAGAGMPRVGEGRWLTGGGLSAGQEELQGVGPLQQEEGGLQEQLHSIEEHEYSGLIVLGEEDEHQGPMVQDEVAYLELPRAVHANSLSITIPGESGVRSDEPPTSADEGYEQEPSNSPAGPGALTFPPLKPTAPSFEGGPGSVPSGAMQHNEGMHQAVKVQGGAAAVAERPGPRGLNGVDKGFTSVESEEEYQANVRQCLDWILEGESYELCLTTRFRSRLGMRVDALRLYQRLRAINPAPYSALLRCGAGLAVCCSSPERYLRIDAAGFCDSKPIKGTRPRGASAEEDAAICAELRECEKDLAENLMIVDLVRNDFGRVCAEGSVRCPKIMDVETYATVHQLVSTIQGQKRQGVSSIDVIRATFPMGSMTGAPKRRSLVLLDQLEGDARGIYSGAIGFLSLNGAVHFNVAIRTAVVTDGGVKVGAGGAITVLSDAQDEWDEMQLKASALLSCAHAVATSI